jgi:hypothetical protein
MTVKSLRPLILLIAGIALTAHLIVPHDHHLAGPAVGSTESCPLSGQSTDNHRHIPVHCQAFNDLAAEKATPVNVKKLTRASFVMVIWHSNYNTQANDLLSTLVENSGDPITFICLPDISPFRGPPSVS